MTKYLDYSGLKKFKSYLDKKMGRATDEDIDNGVLSDMEVEDNIVTIKTLAHYHKKLSDNVKESGSDLNVAVLDVVADALVMKTDGSEEIKSEIYENVEAIVDEKMKWNEEFPE